MGNVLVQPDFNVGETIHFVQLDLGQIGAAKFDLDIAGHYARPDIFRLLVNTKAQKPVEEIDGKMDG
jgi:nitrilase